MKIDQFLIDVDEVIDDLLSGKDAFRENMKHIKMKDQSFCSWLITYFAWIEIGTEEDCENYYWHLMEDEKNRKQREELLKAIDKEKS